MNPWPLPSLASLSILTKIRMICHIIDYTKVYSEHTLYLGTNCPRFRIETFSKLWMQRFVAWILCTGSTFTWCSISTCWKWRGARSSSTSPHFFRLGGGWGRVGGGGWVRPWNLSRYAKGVRSPLTNDYVKSFWRNDKRSKLSPEWPDREVGWRRWGAWRQMWELPPLAPILYSVGGCP